jgi:hypothetical protein
LKHEKHATRRQRRFTFIGTANDEAPIANMLEEDRRFIIIPVTARADLDRIKRNRLQILAEAIEIEKAYGPRLELHDEFRPQACKARAQVVARPEYEDTLAETFGDIVSAKITASDVYAFLGLRDRTAIGKYTQSTGGGINPIMERLGWKHGKLRRLGVRMLAFEKGDGAGWLRVAWPRGNQAPAEIEPDTEVNPDFVPEYASKVGPEVGPEVGPGGWTDANPCGSKAFTDGPTWSNLREEITQEQHSPPLCDSDGAGDIGSSIEGGNSGSKKDCGRKVGPVGEGQNSACCINGLGVVQPPLVQPQHSRAFKGKAGKAVVL